jgi:exosortase
LLAAAAYSPLLLIEASELWRRPHYQFFPLVLLGSGYVAWRDTAWLGQLTPGNRKRSLCLIGVAWAFLGLAVLLMSPWLGTVAALVAVPAAAYGWGGGRLVRHVLPAWALLWVAVPPPGDLDGTLVAGLQSVASNWSSALLDLFHVFHLRTGNVIEVTDRVLLIEEACSGAHSFFVILAGTLFLVLVLNRGALHGLVLVASALLWVVLGNVARIVAVTWCQERWEVDLLGGWRHELAGFGVTVGVLVLVTSTDAVYLELSGALRALWHSRVEAFRRWRAGARGEWLLGACAGASSPAEDDPIRSVSPAAEPLERTRLPALARTALVCWPTTAAVAALALVQVACLWQGVASAFMERDGLGQRLRAVLAANLLPERWGDLRLRSFQRKSQGAGHSMGEFSWAWEYALGRHRVTVSVDYPFKGWHDLPHCYQSQGWTVSSRSRRDSRWGPIEEVELAKTTDRLALLVFRVFDRQGQTLPPPDSGGLSSTAIHGLTDALRAWGAEPWEAFRQRCLTHFTGQIQVFVDGTCPLTEPERGQIRSFLDSVGAAVNAGFPPAPGRGT